VSARTIDGFIVTPRALLRGRVRIDGGRLTAVDGTPVPDDAWRDGSAPVVLPGFIDLHVHGGGGADVMQAGDAIDTMAGGHAVRELARTHARHGTTALLATTMTAPRGEIEAALHALAPSCRTRTPGAARVLGVHLEGPYINPDKLGAQPAFAVLPAAREILALHAIAPLRVVTLAPELPGALDVIAALVAAGLRVQLGHSAGAYEDARAALAQGASGFTHLFNAMSSLHQRAPGVVGAALAHAEHAELIPDLLHVHPGAIRAALRAIPGLYCVTDSTSAAAMPDGEYTLGRQRVHKCLGGVRLADGTLAGSTLTMDQALRNLVGPALGLPLVQAAQRCATQAARYLGLTDRGVIAPGAWADLVVMDSALDLQRVMVEGDDVLAHA
jgi:N-acetylglucosamine-6-phosphate deacetylase